MMVDLEKMSIEELEEKLVKLKESLEDVQEERSIVLGQTGIHLPGSTARKCEIEIKKINKSINKLEELLHKKRHN